MFGWIYVFWNRWRIHCIHPVEHWKYRVGKHVFSFSFGAVGGFVGMVIGSLVVGLLGITLIIIFSLFI